MRSASELIDEAVAAAETALVSSGDWLDGPQRREAWRHTRDARTNALDEARKQAISPNAVAGSHPAGTHLSAEAVDVVHRIASDPGRLSRSWADEVIAALGDGVYTELVGVAAIAAVVDTLAWALDERTRPIGDAVDGGPARVRPDDVGDVGAWVPQSVEVANANVSRALSLVPTTNRAWGGLVNACYSRGAGFYDLAWERALSRPQVELVAARTTAELECFY